jgi:hypothetical protein
VVFEWSVDIVGCAYRGPSLAPYLKRRNSHGSLRMTLQVFCGIKGSGIGEGEGFGLPCSGDYEKTIISRYSVVMRHTICRANTYLSAHPHASRGEGGDGGMGGRGGATFGI